MVFKWITKIKTLNSTGQPDEFLINQLPKLIIYQKFKTQDIEI